VKAFWKSKTFWVNVAAVGAAAGSGGLSTLAIPGVQIVAQALADHPHVSMGVLAASNIGLRFITKGPIGLVEPYLVPPETREP